MDSRIFSLFVPKLRPVKLLICALACLAVSYGQCPNENATNDGRCSFQASAFLGLAIDTFAAGEYGNYAYSGSTANSTSGARESSVVGFDFADRLKGWRDKTTGNFTRQLWVYGETMHGARSADINCSTNPNLPSCATTLASIVKPTNPGDSVLYLLRNASSLEGYLGFRYEFARLNDGGGAAGNPDGTPVNLYVKAQAGFLKVSGAPGSALDVDKIAVGAIATKGNYANSYLDVGFGRNDVFQYNRRRRTMIDGYLERAIPGNFGMSFFAQMLVDTDLGRGSDSFQTYIGVNMDLTKLF